jgi:hypothetical protein
MLRCLHQGGAGKGSWQVQDVLAELLYELLR